MRDIFSIRGALAIVAGLAVSIPIGCLIFGAIRYVHAIKSPSPEAAKFYLTVIVVGAGGLIHGMLWCALFGIYSNLEECAKRLERMSRNDAHRS